MPKCRLCDDPVTARGFCKKHYYQMRSKGTLENFNKKERPLAERIQEKYKISESGCWEWTGQKNNIGYAMIWKDGKAVRAHRESYRIFVGDFDSSLVVCHRCDNPSCINPEHLFVGTRLANNVDAVKKGRNAFGEKNGRSFLTKEHIQAIRQDDRPQSQIAKDFGINQSHVSRIKNNKRRDKG